MIHEAETLSGSGTAGGVTALGCASSLAMIGAGATGAGAGLTVSTGVGCGAVSTGCLGGVETSVFFGAVCGAATRRGFVVFLTGLTGVSSCGITGGVTAAPRVRITGRRL